MHAVFVSFHFLAPKRPCEKLVQAHQQLLERLDGLESSLTLDSRSEMAFLLTYEDEQAIDAYFASEEFQCLSTQPGCNDVFVKEFQIMPGQIEVRDDVLQVAPGEAFEPTSNTLA